ncbi:MAG: PEP-CTERM sorting domain-containing protein [Sedimentisphaerales bacterium]|jgi:hypothetical protein
MSKKLSIFVCALCLVSIAVPAKALTNGDFETGDLTGWWTWLPDPANETVSVVPGGPGTSVYAAEIYTLSGSSAQLGQDIAFSAGLPVSVSLMYDVPANNWAGAGITIQYKDASWSVLDWGWANIYGGGGGGGGGWLSYDTASDGTKSGNWTSAPAGTAYLTLKIEQWGWQPSGSLYDNVVLTPEPATMVLLGIGGLVALRRKHA